MKGYRHLTAADEAAIRRLTQAGEAEKQIARALLIHRSTVYRVQKKLGLTLPRHGPRCPVFTKEQENKALRLLRSGFGIQRVARALGLREWSVRRVAERNHVKRRPGQYGFRLRLSEKKRKKILEEIRMRVNYATDIAWKFKVPYRSVVRMAHDELRCPRFRSGRSVEPLTSDFPQRHFRGEINPG